MIFLVVCSTSYCFIEPRAAVDRTIRPNRPIVRCNDSRPSPIGIGFLVCSLHTLNGKGNFEGTQTRPLANTRAVRIYRCKNIRILPDTSAMQCTYYTVYQRRTPRDSRWQCRWTGKYGGVVCIFFVVPQRPLHINFFVGNSAYDTCSMCSPYYSFFIFLFLC